MGFFDIRAAMRGGFGANQATILQANQQSELLVAGGNLPNTETTRQGATWNVISAALAPLVALPSTVAGLEIFNNTQGPGAITLEVNDLFAFQLLSTAASQTYAIFAMVTTQKVLPSNGALSLFSQSGRPLQATVAGGRIITAAGTTVVANGWRPWGKPQAWGTATATPGNAWNEPVNGALLVPPQCSLCLHIVGALATASSFQVGCSVSEKALVLPV